MDGAHHWFIAMITLTAPILFLRQRVKPAKPREIIDKTVFADGPLMLFSLAALVGFIGLYVMFFYVSYYAETHSTSTSMAFYTVPILNAASIFGRTLPNWLSDKTGPLNILIPGSMVCAILALCMQAVHDLAVSSSPVCRVFVWSLFKANAAFSFRAKLSLPCFFGFFSGVFVALPPVAFIALTADKSKLGTRIGMGFAFTGLGTLIGGPGGGAILGKTHGNLHWTETWVFGGVTLLGSAALMLGLRLWKTGFKVAVKC
jgi:MFS family permease